jgi:hypothetical protein
MQLLEGLPDGVLRRQRIDPVPPSTLAHLRRLALQRFNA